MGNKHQLPKKQNQLPLDEKGFIESYQPLQKNVRYQKTKKNTKSVAKNRFCQLLPLLRSAPAGAAALWQHSRPAAPNLPRKVKPQDPFATFKWGFKMGASNVDQFAGGFH